jgi:DNA replication and repair protein RecF
MRRRVALIDEIRPGFVQAFSAIGRGDRPANLRYAPELAGAEAIWKDESALAARLGQALVANRTRDLARTSTTAGPHRDDLLLLLDDRPASAFASQGQLRAMILAWKIAEIELLTAAHGESPILLLDDVSSELDPRRNEYLFEYLGKMDSQVMVTTTHPRYVLTTRDRVDYEVSSGYVTRQNSG